MTIKTERISEAYKTNVETMNEIVSKLVENIENVAKLNTNLLKDNINASSKVAEAAMQVKDINEFIELQHSLIKPFSDKAIHYSKELQKIASDTHTDLSKVTERYMSTWSKNAENWAEEAAGKSPIGSDTALAMTKTAINAMNSFYDVAQKAGRQTVEATQKNIKTATNAASRMAQEAEKSSAKK